MGFTVICKLEMPYHEKKESLELLYPTHLLLSSAPKQIWRVVPGQQNSYHRATYTVSNLNLII